MDKLLYLPLLPLVVTLGAYLFGLWCQKKVKHSLCNPFLIAVVLVGGFLIASKLPMENYQAGMDAIGWLITPVTVCLAVPLYEQLKVLRKNLPAILVGIAAGALSCLIMVLGLAAIFTLNRELTVSLLPKSITTAVGMAVSSQNGGIPSLTAGAIAITGLVGILLGPILCKLFHLKDPVSQGVAYGTSCHVIGTSKATQIDPLCGAVSSLSLVVAALLTTAVLPIVCMWI